MSKLALLPTPILFLGVLGVLGLVLGGAVLVLLSVTPLGREFGHVGAAIVPITLDSKLSQDGVLRAGDFTKDKFWKKTQIEKPLISATEFCIALRWETESSALEARIWLPLIDAAPRRARAEVQRVTLEGKVYSHGRGLEGSVSVNRTSIPHEADGPFVIDFTLTDYDGGSPGKIAARVAYQPADFR